MLHRPARGAWVAGVTRVIVPFTRVVASLATRPGGGAGDRVSGVGLIAVSPCRRCRARRALPPIPKWLRYLYHKRTI
jgi:hypothetical protein